MRSFLVTLSVLFMLAVASHGGDINVPKPRYRVSGSFLEVMKTHFQNSMDYLFNSKQHDSQFLERPGMAKFLMAASDYEWEQGQEFLMKFMEKDGRLEDYQQRLQIRSSIPVNDIMTLSTTQKIDVYNTTMSGVLNDAVSIFDTMNDVRTEAMTTNGSQRADHEICHFLDEKMEKKSKRIYEVKNLVTVLKGMTPLGIAVDAFDSAL